MGKKLEKFVRRPRGLEGLKRARDELEQIYASETPKAYSVDGRTFQFELPLSSAVRTGSKISTGSYVEIRLRDGTSYFGQVIEKAITEREGPEYGLGAQATGRLWLVTTRERAHLKDRLTIPLIKGQGLLLGKFTNKDFTLSNELAIFENAELLVASPSTVDRYFAQTRPITGNLDVGTPIHGTEKCRVGLDGAGFDRHTFLTGQSRSGKSFAMGVILEQFLLARKLRMVVIDPNSDFIRLDEFLKRKDLNQVRTKPLSDTAYRRTKKRYEKVAKDIRILGAHENVDATHVPLRIRFSDLKPTEMPAVLKIDPLHDGLEFHSLQTLIEGLDQTTYSLEDVLAAARQYFFEESRKLGLRIINQGILEWAVWKEDGNHSIIDILNQKRRCTVIDIGALATEEERLMISMVVLGHLWEARAKRERVLVVIDEAHNVAPAEPSSELQRVCSDLAVRIAGEGLKYGISLMISTQRPDKLNANVMSQCENQIIMRMTSSADLATVARTFSQIPEGLVNECAAFQLGNALISGRIVHAPTFVQFDGRLSYEGGGDVETT